LLAVGIAFVQQGGLRGRLVEIEQTSLNRITFQLDVNKAAWPELTQLPNVGETLARRIVRHRDRHGPFSTVHDLEQVEGIGPKTMAQIQPFLLPLVGPEQVVGNVP
jgi:competence protein ComEA